MATDSRAHRTSQILYGIQTTGNGHMSRAVLMAARLKAMGHQVVVLFSGAAGGNFWDLQPLQPYHRFRGLAFVIRNGCIDRLGTALRLNVFQAYRDILSFNDRALTWLSPILNLFPLVYIRSNGRYPEPGRLRRLQTAAVR